ncbi:MAG: beta-ketoacyl-ACP synthase [Thermosynechococcaceae cyanobacterium]
MTEVWVTGMSLCSALGTTLPTSWSALLQGKSGVAFHQPFPEIPPHPLGLIGQTPTSVDDLLARAVPEVLADAQLHPSPQVRWGFSVGSSRGYQAELEALIRQQHLGLSWPSPDCWLKVYGQSPGCVIAQQLHLNGPVLAPRAACATGLWVIAQGAELIRTGQCDVVIAGAVDAPITPLTLAGFRQMGALTHTGVYPFDCRRSGFALGEGIGLLLLERKEHAQRRNAQPYGQVLGFGLTNDACYVNAPAPDRYRAIMAIQDCLRRSLLHPAQVDYIHAHGTGTILNDEMEAEMISKLFGHQIAVSSTKGATGHTLGASGAMGAIFSLMALHQQILPPCVGLQDPIYPLRWVIQGQPSSAVQVTLCLSFGFGGQNAAIAFALTTPKSEGKYIS